MITIIIIIIKVIIIILINDNNDDYVDSQFPLLCGSLFVVGAATANMRFRISTKMYYDVNTTLLKRSLKCQRFISVIVGSLCYVTLTIVVALFRHAGFIGALLSNRTTPVNSEDITYNKYTSSVVVLLCIK